jgi:ribulose-5-phosphate 4-epimerase/fuculose-1-phosphate aldolase
MLGPHNLAREAGMAASDRRAPAYDDPALDELKRDLVTGCHVLDREGITDGWGHLSARVPDTDTFLTIARVSPRLADLEHLVLLDFNGNYLGGRNTPPFEWPIHARAMKARPDVNSVCHTHSLWSVMFSVLPIKLRPLHNYGTFLPADGLPVFEPAGLITTPELGDALAATLGQNAATLMRSHGDTVVGASIQETVQRTVRLAKLGELQHLALLHGEPRYLSAEEIARMGPSSLDPMRGWGYYLDRLPENA